MTVAAHPFEHSPVATFRGARDYVHSTDLYEEIVAGAQAAGVVVEGPIDLRIRGRITHRPIYAFAPCADAPDRHAPATCTYRSGTARWGVTIRESEEPVSARKPYDESPASRFSRIDGRSIELVAPTDMRPIECLTALGVALHRTALPPPNGKRWMLGQLTLSRALIAEDAIWLKAAIVRIVGDAIARSTIVARDGELGAMVFILA